MNAPRFGLIASLLIFTAACQREGAAPTPAAARATSGSEFARFVDAWLDDFGGRHPSIAAGNGLHAHDDVLEDFSKEAIVAEVESLRRDRARLDAMGGAAPFAVDEEVDRRILAGIIDGWLLDLAVVETWRKNPMIYAAAVSDGVHQLMTMESDTLALRAERAARKLRGVPTLVAQARANVVAPPPFFATRGAEMMHATATMLLHDLPKAFAGIDPQKTAILEDAAATAAKSLEAYAHALETEPVRSPPTPFAIGAENLAARYRAEELIDLPLSDLLAIGERELAAEQATFRAVAIAAAPGKDPLETWKTVLVDHPKRGELLAAVQSTLDELTRFSTSQRLVTLPPNESLEVAAAPEFDLGFASMHASPPLEARPVKSFFYVTDARADWPESQQNEWLKRFNRSSLAVTAAHEAMPGHWVHALHMRRTPGKIRRIWIGLNPFPQPSSGQDGWAHYAEQLVADEGFRGGDPAFRLAQIADALTRICRLLVSARLHSEGWTIDQGARFFEQNAYLPPAAARREAERGTYDPTNGGYFLGKRALLKLRRDVAAHEGAAFDLARFHARVMTNGIAPWWAHRRLLLGELGGGGKAGDVLD